MVNQPRVNEINLQNESEGPVTDLTAVNFQMLQGDAVEEGFCYEVDPGAGVGLTRTFISFSRQFAYNETCRSSYQLLGTDRTRHCIPKLSAIVFFILTVRKGGLENFGKLLQTAELTLKVAEAGVPPRPV